MNASFLSLGVSLATSTIIFTGVKNLSGKPRPDFLARCEPDLEQVTAHTVGGYGQSISNLWVMVDGGICQQSDKKFLNDGFRSFPSRYATSEAAGMRHCMLLTSYVVALAGLWYLSLYLAARFGVVPPSATDYLQRRDRVQQNDEAGETLMQSDEPEDNGFSRVDKDPAAPPAYLLPLPCAPLGLAIFLAGTRFFDFRNHGIDVLAGSAVGTTTAWFGFRLHHPPLASHLGGSFGAGNNSSIFPGRKSFSLLEAESDSSLEQSASKICMGW